MPRSTKPGCGTNFGQTWRASSGSEKCSRSFPSSRVCRNKCEYNARSITFSSSCVAESSNSFHTSTPSIFLGFNALSSGGNKNELTADSEQLTSGKREGGEPERSAPKAESPNQMVGAQFLTRVNLLHWQLHCQVKFQ